METYVILKKESGNSSWTVFCFVDKDEELIQKLELASKIYGETNIKPAKLFEFSVNYEIEVKK